MNLYNFILNRDKLLHQIKARKFIWFLRALRVCLAVALKRFCLKILEWQVGCLFWKKNIQNLTICKTFIHGNHYTRECSGMEGRERMGEKPGAGFWSWSPHTLSFRYKCIQALFINQYSSCLHPTPHPPQTPSGIANHIWSGAIGPSLPAQEVLFGWLLVEHLFFLSSLPEEAGVALRAVWFWMIIFGFYFIILDHYSPYPFLPPSLLNMYNNYTETAINLYIVFGSNSMRRWGTI